MNANTMRLKEINVDQVRRVLRNTGSATRNTISEMTGLSIATCGNILGELLETGEITELDPAESTGGRPSRRFRYNHDFAHVIIIYARKEGRSAGLYSAVTNLAGREVVQEHSELPDIRAEDMEAVIGRYLGDFPAIRSVAVGVPAVVRDGVVGIGDFPGLSGLPLAERLEDRFGIPVVLENDVNLAALGNHHDDPCTGGRITACLYYPRDGYPGAGIIVNGDVLRGHSHFAGEVSFLPSAAAPGRHGRNTDPGVNHPDAVARTIQSITCVIDPEKLLLIGLAFTDRMVAEIRKKVADVIPEPHGPRIDFEADIHANMAAGLKYLAIQELSCGLELIARGDT